MQADWATIHDLICRVVEHLLAVESNDVFLAGHINLDLIPLTFFE